MKFAISTASSYSDSIRIALESAGHRVEILNAWGNRIGLNKLLDNPGLFKTLLLQWPEALLSQSELHNLDIKIINEVSITLRRIKQIGVDIIFTFHNLSPHEFEKPRPIDKEYYRTIIANSSKILHHSRSGLLKAFEEYPQLHEKRNEIFRHPPYYFINQYNKDIELVRELNLNSKRKYFLFIGSITKYKNLDFFLNTLKSLNRSRYGLIIAGKSYDNTLINLSSQFSYLLQSGYDIKIIEKWLSNSEISNLVKASNYLICNNSNDKLTSGIPHLCEAGKKILYSDIGNEYINEVAKKYLIVFDSLSNKDAEKKIFNCLEQIYNENNKKKVGENLLKIICDS